MAFGDSLAEVLREISELKRVVANMMRIGTVHSIDPAKGTVRLKYGEVNGQPILGPEIPWMEQGGGFKTWQPPTIGQTMVSFNPVGDQRQGMALNAAFSTQNAAPSDKGDENIRSFGQFRETIKSGQALAGVDKSRTEVKPDLHRFFIGDDEVMRPRTSADNDYVKLRIGLVWLVLDKAQNRIVSSHPIVQAPDPRPNL